MSSAGPLRRATSGHRRLAGPARGSAWARLRRLDPRVLQLSFQGCLLLLGALWLDFALAWQQVALCFVAALCSQAAWLHGRQLRDRGFLSAVVTALGLSLLVRADNLWVHPLLAVLTISSKFVWRYDFMPGNLRLAAHTASIQPTWARCWPSGCCRALGSPPASGARPRRWRCWC